MWTHYIDSLRHEACSLQPADSLSGASDGALSAVEEVLQFFVDESVRCNDPAFFEHDRVSFKVRDPAARFFDEPQSCGDVPRPHITLVESFHSSCRHGGQT